MAVHGGGSAVAVCPDQVCNSRKQVLLDIIALAFHNGVICSMFQLSLALTLNLLLMALQKDGGVAACRISKSDFFLSTY